MDWVNHSVDGFKFLTSADRFGALLALELVVVGIWNLRRELHSRMVSLLTPVLFLLAWNQIQPGGRAVTAYGLFPPGAPLARWLPDINYLTYGMVESSFELQRALQIIFLLSLVSISKYFRRQFIQLGHPARTTFKSRCVTRQWGNPTLLILAICILFILTELLSFYHLASTLLLTYLHAILSLMMIPLVLLQSPRIVTTLSPLILLLAFVSQTVFLPHLPPLSLAHYYSWFPENWRTGFIGEKLKSPVLPILGRYASEDKAVIKQHLTWATQAGLTGFIFDWWPRRPIVNRRVRGFVNDFVNSSQVSNEFRFAIQYETLDLRSPDAKPIVGESENVVFLTKKRAERLERELVEIGREFFSSPNYLSIHNRPVIFLYATRHVIGPLPEAIQRLRVRMRSELGVNPFIVGDEIYFNAITYTEQRGEYLLPEGEPDWGRISAFDALTAYNLFDGSKPEFGGSAGVELFLKKSTEIFLRYKHIAVGAGQVFLPSVIPGYNDRGVRLSANHYVIPRNVSATSLFHRQLSEVVKPLLESRSPRFTVTSWNEWNEGTQIEPASGGEIASASDESLSGNEFSRGESLGGYGAEYLTLLKQFIQQLESVRNSR